jgi:hypothetical protein
MEAKMKKSELLFAANYRYNFDRDMYVNFKAKKAFSLEFVDDKPEEDILRGIEEVADGNGWKFYFNHPPSDGLKRVLIQDLEAA